MDNDKTRWKEFNLIIDNEKIVPKAKLLLLAIFRYYNDSKGYSYPSKEKLKKICGFKNDRDYYRYLKILEDMKIISKKTIRGLGCKFYITHCQNDSGTHCQNDSEPTAKMTVQKEKKRKIKENIYINIYSDLESKIIELYPGKKTKSVRDKKVPGLIKEYGGEQVIRCIERYAKQCKAENKEKQYILNEGTFWNGRYMDFLDSNYHQEFTKPSSKTIKFTDFS